jgi:hypothetical protein
MDEEALEMVEGRSWAVELNVFDRLEVSQREGDASRKINTKPGLGRR